MSKVKPTTKEQLVYYLIHHISLGTYDNRFLTNLQDILIIDKKPATSNQAALLDKVTLRYARQLRKQEIDANEMIKLPWGVEPIESIPEFTDAFCTIEDDTIKVRSPYHKEFITDIKKTEIYLNWDKETKIWSAPFCEYSLKHFIDCLEKHYAIIHYCEKTAKIIQQFAEYESATVWNPTYMKVNNNYLIAGSNKHLDDALSDVVFDAEPSTLARVFASGVDISKEVKVEACEELWGTDYAHRLITFATTHGYTHSISELPTLVQMIKDIKCDFVLLVESFKNTKTNHVATLHDLLETAGVNHSVFDKKSDEDLNLKQYNFPIIINTSLWSNSKNGLSASKTIFLGNNTPIDIK